MKAIYTLSLPFLFFALLFTYSCDEAETDNDKEKQTESAVEKETTDEKEPEDESFTIDGSYSYNEEDTVSGTLEVAVISEQAIEFTIFVNHSNGCTGLLEEAHARKQSDNVYLYNDGQCELTFTFTEHSVIVDEDLDCDEWHGMVCAFNGEYHRE